MNILWNFCSEDYSGQAVLLPGKGGHGRCWCLGRCFSFSWELLLTLFRWGDRDSDKPVVIKLPELLLVRQNPRALLFSAGSFANKGDSTQAQWTLRAAGVHRNVPRNASGAVWDCRKVSMSKASGMSSALLSQGACKAGQWHWQKEKLCLKTWSRLQMT